jgi:hypothetical protein
MALFEGATVKARSPKTTLAALGLTVTLAALSAQGAPSRSIGPGEPVDFNMDPYERVQPADLMNNAVIIAAFVYHAANRNDLLPRRPLPKPRAPRPTTTAQ